MGGAELFESGVETLPGGNNDRMRQGLPAGMNFDSKSLEFQGIIPFHNFISEGCFVRSAPTVLFPGILLESIRGKYRSHPKE